MTPSERLRAFTGAILAWLATPSSRAGIVVMVSAGLGHKLAPGTVDAIVTGVMVIAGALLVAWPERPQP